MKTVCILNNKGGVGKSATAFETAAALSKMGYRVLCIDLDEQNSITLQLMSRKEFAERKMNTVIDVLTERCGIKEAIRKTKYFDLVPGDNKTRTLDKILTEPTMMFNLKVALDEVEEKYDICIIDEPAHLGVCAYLGMYATKDKGGIIIPTDPDTTTMQGIVTVSEFVEKNKMMGNFKIVGILKIKFRNWRFHKASENLINQISDKIGCDVFNTSIRECTAFKEAKSQNMSIIDYKPTSSTAKDYIDFAYELAEKLGL